MYRENINLVSVFVSLALAFTSSAVFAVDVPATEATMAQMNEFIVIVALLFSFSMGAIFGHMR